MVEICLRCSLRASNGDTMADIQQIIPATGWVALFEGEKDDEPDVRPVACWALVSDERGQRVVPFVSDDGTLVDATRLDGYGDVAVETDVLDDLFGDGDEGDCDGPS